MKVGVCLVKMLEVMERVCSTFEPTEDYISCGGGLESYMMSTVVEMLAYLMPAPCLYYHLAHPTMTVPY